MLPVGRRKVELVVLIPRLYCKDCGSIRQPQLTFADPKKHYTKSLERFVIDLCRVVSIQDVAELTGLSWDTVKEIHKGHLRRKYRWFNLKRVGYLALNLRIIRMYLFWVWLGLHWLCLWGVHKVVHFRNPL